MTLGNGWNDNDTNGWTQYDNNSEWKGDSADWKNSRWNETAPSEWTNSASEHKQSAPDVEPVPSYANRAPAPEWDTWKTTPKENNVVVKDDDDVHVVRGKDGTKKVTVWRTFAEVRESFPAGLVDILTDGKVANFSKPTSIQAYTWPSIMEGEDIIGVAKTGSGKTLAFLLPGFIRIKQFNHDAMRNGPKILVLAPTRELCQQIYDESVKFGEPADIFSACAYGGADKMPQLQKFRRGPHIAIACPGRLNDYLQKGQVRLGHADYFVLDEADRMLDMGFEPQIRDILRFIPDQRQSLLFSATWPPEVQQIARSICYKDNVHIQVGTADSLTANSDITQHVIFVDNDAEKWQHLQKVLDETFAKGSQNRGALVFTATKRGCADLARNLNDYMRVSTTALHGDMEQRQRDRALQRFKEGSDQIMVATDVAQRGLDVRNVGVVVNWDAPNNIEDYVHRIGRTGRAGDHGDAYTFLNRSESQKAKDIAHIMQKAGQEVPADLLQVSRSNFSASYGASRSRYSSGKY